MVETVASIAVIIMIVCGTLVMMGFTACLLYFIWSLFTDGKWR